MQVPHLSGGILSDSKRRSAQEARCEVEVEVEVEGCAGTRGGPFCGGDGGGVVVVTTARRPLRECVGVELCGSAVYKSKGID